MLGHDGPPSGQMWDKNLITDAPLTRCPVRVIQLAPAAERAEMRRYVDSYIPGYADGFLLVEGGLADQPARYLELVQLGRAYHRTVESKYLEVKAEEAASEAGPKGAR